MRAALAKPLDWCSIQLARLSVRDRHGVRGQLSEVEAFLEHPDFLCDFVESPQDLRFVSKHAFQFTSAVTSPWKRNNTVHGRFFAASKQWQDQPTLVLLHGWNQEAGYRVLLPYLGRRLTKRGVNAAMIELPYHSQRKPRGRKAVRNFLSGDLWHVAQATHQAIADARALVAWLKEQGCPRVGLWGISLGAWLTGLLACADEHVDYAVLMIPVPRLDRVIADLDFCAPIRRSLGGATPRLGPLNLATRQPKLAPQDILVVASEHDLFAPIATTEELCQAWGGVELWRIQHGHISALMSMPVMERTIAWAARKANAGSR